MFIILKHLKPSVLYWNDRVLIKAYKSIHTKLKSIIKEILKERAKQTKITFKDLSLKKTYIVHFVDGLLTLTDDHLIK